MYIGREVGSGFKVWAQCSGTRVVGCANPEPCEPRIN